MNINAAANSAFGGGARDKLINREQHHALSDDAEDGLADIVDIDVDKSSSFARFRKASWTAITSRYLYASIVYIVYSVAMVCNNYYGDTTQQNYVYYIFAWVHLINAAMYVYSWDSKGWLDYELFPDYLNCVGAALYLYSATLYDYIYTSNDDAAGYSDSFYNCRHVELAAAVVEMFASIGWVLVWYYNFVEKNGPLVKSTTSTQGLTPLDPDMHANWSIILGAVFYLAYNIQVSTVVEDFEGNDLYVIGDMFYLINAAFYFFAAMRDYGFFWFIEFDFFCLQATRRVDNTINKKIEKDAIYQN